MEKLRWSELESFHLNLYREYNESFCSFKDGLSFKIRLRIFLSLKFYLFGYENWEKQSILKIKLGRIFKI